MIIDRLLVGRIVVIFLGTVVNGCDGARSLAPKSETANGIWELVTEVPSRAEHWMLTVNGGAVSGQGTAELGAPCPVSSTITGSARGDSLHLDVAYYVDCSGQRISFRATPDHIEAVLDSFTELLGTRWIPVSTWDVIVQPVHFRKSTR
jgi:hypothetical protein